MWGNFSGAVDYGQCVKNYRTGSARGPDHRYEPPCNPFITKTAVIGVPRPELMSTSYVERFNLTARHTVGRTRRLCLAFSKTLRGLRAAMALGIASYNLVRVHGALETTPAVASDASGCARCRGCGCARRGTGGARSGARLRADRSARPAQLETGATKAGAALAV
jgi:hypothetical protein